jgi:membrane protease YdiL (CAAX protease family)
VGPRDVSLVFWFMALVNGPAEELYWRGFVHTELADDPGRLRILVLTAACYAAYHGVTVFLLLSSWLWSGAILALIWSAGLFWGRLRETTGSVWPPLLAHTGAAAAYMIAARPLLGS